MAEHGWLTPTTLIALGVAVIALAAFLIVELRHPQPMLPVRWFADPRFTVPNAGSFLLAFTVFALGVFLPAYLQQAQHHSAATVGLMLMPAAVVAVTVPPLTGHLVARIGPRLPMTAGLLLAATGLATLLAIGPDTGYARTVTALILMNAGYGLLMPASNTAAMAAVQQQRTGSASSTIAAIRQTGTTFGIALFGALLASEMSSTDGRTAEQAHTDGLHLIAFVAAMIALAAAALVATAMRTDASKPVDAKEPAAKGNSVGKQQESTVSEVPPTPTIDQGRLT